MKISIVIPVYNIEKYISQCLESIINICIENLEILLVDDGSTDKSGEICDEFAQQYNYIKVFHTINSGASHARNLGLQKARGEYIWFIDGDDFIINGNYIKDIIKNLTYDFVQFKMIYYYTNKNKYFYLNDIIDDLKYDDMLGYIKSGVYNGTLSVSPCDKIIKRDVLIKNHIFFNEDIVAEDIDWSLKLYLYTKSFEIYNYDIYCYRQNREGSVTTNVTEKNIDSLFFILEYWCKYQYPNKILKDYYFSYLAYQFVILLTIANYRKYQAEIHHYMFLLDYDKCYKVKLSKKVIRIFGVRNAKKILMIYEKIKRRGIIKL